MITYDDVEVLIRIFDVAAEVIERAEMGERLSRGDVMALKQWAFVADEMLRADQAHIAPRE